MVDKWSKIGYNYQQRLGSSHPNGPIRRQYEALLHGAALPVDRVKKVIGETTTLQRVVVVI